MTSVGNSCWAVIRVDISYTIAIRKASSERNTLIIMSVIKVA
jgi:hypothetical protein